MPEPTTICCCVDFSDASRRALGRATDLAALTSAQLILVHVVERPSSAVATVFAGQAVLGEVTARDAERSLATWREAAEETLRRPVEATLATGDPVEEIVRIARDRGCDLVVIASNGRSGVRSRVLGSVAERLARQAPCAVLIERQGDAVQPVVDPEELAQYRAG